MKNSEQARLETFGALRQLHSQLCPTRTAVIMTTDTVWNLLNPKPVLSAWSVRQVASAASRDKKIGGAVKLQISDRGRMPILPLNLSKMGGFQTKFSILWTKNFRQVEKVFPQLSDSPKCREAIAPTAMTSLSGVDNLHLEKQKW